MNRFSRILYVSMPFVALAIALAAALGGGATVAAHNSLPGDALWSYKTRVSEGIRTTLAGSTEARAAAHLAAIESRLIEAERLAAEGRLDAAANKSLVANFDMHAKALADTVAALQEAGRFAAAADIAARFQATVAARAAALAQSSSVAATGDESSPLLLTLRTTLDQASDMSAEASAKAAVEAE